MPSVCFYFQVHQPHRLATHSLLDTREPADLFDTHLNREIIRKVARKCYLPANHKLLELIRRHPGEFQVSFSITGVALEQMAEHAPEALLSFQELAATGAVEILGETYHHSLAALDNPQEFTAQVRQHGRLVEELFHQQPRVFRNTELIYDDTIGSLVAGLGFEAMLTEGADDILGWRSPNFVYRHPSRPLSLLLKNYRLSDDIAFRFSNRAWRDWPLTAEKMAGWIRSISGAGDVVGLFMDYETFGEHQWEETGIFEFLDAPPEKLFALGDWHFRTPSQVLDLHPSVAALPCGRRVSWADEDRDTTAWLGNRMQRHAYRALYELAEPVAARNNPALTDVWRRLQTSDHLYYMCTKWSADGDVHAYFSPYESPYDAYINFMTALEKLTDLMQPTAQLAESSVTSL